MKEQMFGLKKEPIDSMIQKMEKDFLYEKVGLEYELNMLVTENNGLRSQLKEMPGKHSIVYDNQDLWSLGKERINRIEDFLLQQTEMEMADLREVYTESSESIRREIQKVESEIRSTELLFSKMFHQIANLVGIAETEGKEPQHDHFEWPSENTEVTTPNNEENHTEEGFSVEYEESKASEELSPPEDSREHQVQVIKPSPETESGNNDNLLEQIDAIKSRYIIGRVAGEDLHDANGNLIISKAHVITKQAVSLAHKEGKLAELIMNMTSARLGAD